MVPIITVQVAHHLYGAPKRGEFVGGDPQDGLLRAGSGPPAHQPPPEARNRLTAARAASARVRGRSSAAASNWAVGVEHVGPRDQPALVSFLDIVASARERLDLRGGGASVRLELTRFMHAFSTSSAARKTTLR